MYSVYFQENTISLTYSKYFQENTVLRRMLLYALLLLHSSSEKRLEKLLQVGLYPGWIHNSRQVYIQVGYTTEGRFISGWRNYSRQVYIQVGETAGGQVYIQDGETTAVRFISRLEKLQQVGLYPGWRNCRRIGL